MSLKIFSEAGPQLQSALLALDAGLNIILHSSGGTGKSHSLRLIASYLTEQGKIVACTATTGVAALNLNVPEKQIMARTLHSWSGIKLGRLPAEKLYARVYQKKQYRDRWRETHVLIIDEISMLGSSLLEKLDYIGRKIRTPPRRLKGEISKPFGGLQLVLSGDFLQLPPVKDGWCFNSPVWKELQLIPIIFSEPKRYDDLRYFNLLLRVRKGEHTEEDLQLLQKRVHAYDRLQEILTEIDSPTVIKPTILFSKKIDVQAYNEKELAKLPGPTQEFCCVDTFTAFTKGTRGDSYLQLLDDMIPKAVILRVGAQIMLKANLDVQAGLVNGTRGVITEISTEGDEPVVSVKFLNGKSLRLIRHSWSIEDKDGFASRSQFPLILAWACTIHKGQGATLDYAICDLGPSVFTEGQAYVALSRVRNLKGLFISELYSPRIEVNPEALEFEKELCEKEGMFQVRGQVCFEESDDDEPDLEVPSGPGKIRVGKILYGSGKPEHPSFEGFTPIVVMTKSSKYGSLGPYCLRNSEGHIMENIWQFSKVYPRVPASKQVYSRYDSTVIWKHPPETHTEPKTQEPLEAYWKWREKGFGCSYPVRYPVGRAHRKNCLYSLKEKGGKRLSYVEARKEIYLPVYCDLVRKEPQFAGLQARLQKGENLLIIEVDGPHQESLEYYQETYRVSEDFIEDDTMLATFDNLKIMLNDSKHPFGHGYCLAAALLGLNQDLMET